MEHMNKFLNVLLLEDSENDAVLTEFELERAGLQPKVHRIWTEEQMKEALEQQSWDLILSDFSMPSFSGLQGLSLLKQSGLDIPFIVLSGTIGEEGAANAIRAGAKDFVSKGNRTKLIASIQRELDEARERNRNKCQQLIGTTDENLRALLDNSITGMYVIQDYQFVYVNATICRILGYTATELTSRPLVEFIAEDQRQKVQENVRQRLDGLAKKAHYTLKMICNGGTITEVEVHGTRSDYNGKPSIFGILLDISKRKQAEERFSKMFRSSPIGMCLSSAKDGFIIEVNEAFLSIVGESKENVIGQTLGDFEIRIESQEGAASMGGSCPNRLIKNILTTIKRDTGEILQVLVSSERIDIGKEACAMTFFNDITEIKKIEEQLLRNQRMESIGTLAGGIAHDLNNALAPILMSSQLLRMELTEPHHLQILGVLDSSAKRGADMVRQVLTFARGIEGKHGLVQVKHLLRDMVAMTRQTFPKSIEIREETGAELWAISGDATQLHQVLLNLCVNARDAMHNGGLLTITTTNVELDEKTASIHPEAKPGAYICISVADTGSGMPAHVQKRIFEPFFTTKEIGKGTGLGLSTVRSIVKNHNGFLTLESAENRGTNFRIYLPAKPGADSSNYHATQLSLPSGHGEWILVVDDEAVIRDIARQMLQSFSYNVLTAGNGAEAVAMCAKNPGKIKVMITDLTMPIMDGAATIEAVKSIDTTIKVIVASGSALQRMVKAPDSSTVCAVLEKPYTPEKLLTTIHSILHS